MRIFVTELELKSMMKEKRTMRRNRKRERKRRRKKKVFQLNFNNEYRLIEINSRKKKEMNLIKI